MFSFRDFFAGQQQGCAKFDKALARVLPVSMDF
jgi:hypothetical protein